MARLNKHIVDQLETYKDLFDNAHDLIHILEPDGEIIYVNKAWQALLGFSEAEISGKSIYSFIDDADRARFVEYRQGVVKGAYMDRQITVGMRTKKGDLIHLEGFVSPKVVARTGLVHSRFFQGHNCTGPGRGASGIGAQGAEGKGIQFAAPFESRARRYHRRRYS